ncbi:MaoC family dehydratase [Gordonia jinhuaensis]|uniref:Acyl dehydratase n=1 Tax=Gordonia jinhuaensis TaxID=1517702 RepID=A0A916TCX9_9ACTN|nr:MaoC family dehydratase [Gordonia jinhuaensis]GGB38624.1 acyl dehydratase [Gordonia jinhuaensis]
MSPIIVGGPYFDELEIGQIFDGAPAVTLTDGAAAAHQAILGDRLRLALDRQLSREVTFAPAALAHPGLVTDIAIGQSTLATHHVKANLFYRGLRFLSWPHIGDTITTTTEVVGLRENSRKPGRAPTGLAALRMRTVDDRGQTVLDFYRCAMLPLAAGAAATGRDDDLSAIGEPDAAAAGEAGDQNCPDWDLLRYREQVPGEHFTADLAGRRLLTSADVVTGATELARLTLNIAATHHDARVSGDRRLVYGGHTIGLALSQATRALPNIVTVLGWQSCDHTGPVHEGDTLSSEIEIEHAWPLRSGGALALRSIVHSHDSDGSSRPVLDWRYTVLMA